MGFFQKLLRGIFSLLHLACYTVSRLTTQFLCLKLGISDSISIVLDTIYDTGDSCPLSDIYKKSGISKQTIHSAIRALEADGIVALERDTGRSKRVVLTERGREYVQKTAARLYEAEIRAFDSWSEEEVDTYIRLMEQYTACFRRQIEEL